MARDHRGALLDGPRDLAFNNTGCLSHIPRYEND
jgi:hypothetical protein